MNKDIIKGHWKEIKGKIKQQWGKLTDDDIATMSGTFNELEGKLQKTYGYDKEKVKTEINTFLKRNGFDESDKDLQ